MSSAVVPAYPSGEIKTVTVTLSGQDSTTTITIPGGGEVVTVTQVTTVASEATTTGKDSPPSSHQANNALSQ